MVRLVALEWFKLRKRWMPWVLLGILLGLLLLSQGGIYLGYTQLRALAEGGGAAGQVPPEVARQQLEALRQALVFPQAAAGPFSLYQSFGGLLLVILAASLMGAEYAWRTVATTLVRGVGRASLLGAKVALLLLVLTGALVAAVAVGLLAALPVHGAVSGGLDLGAFPSVPTLLAMAGRTWIATLPLALLAAMVAVLTRSSAVGMGVGLAYTFLEGIFTGLLRAAGGVWETLTTFSIAYNTQSLLALNNFVEGAGSAGISFGFIPEDPSFWRAALLLLAYCAVFLGAAFWVFLRRDVAPAQAE